MTEGAEGERAVDYSAKIAGLHAGLVTNTTQDLDSSRQQADIQLGNSDAVHARRRFPLTTEGTLCFFEGVIGGGIHELRDDVGLVIVGY
jgi:hypothetical protein